MLKKLALASLLAAAPLAALAETYLIDVRPPGGHRAAPARRGARAPTARSIFRLKSSRRKSAKSPAIMTPKFTSIAAAAAVPVLPNKR